jgi:SH3 domain-containing protein
VTPLLAALALNAAQTFEHANEDYYRGDFAAAAAGYERVLALGVGGADLYYNLGNAYLRAGKTGHAIWGYERALVLAPDDEDVAWNLRAAREQAESRFRDRLMGDASEPLWIRAVTWAGRPALMWTFLSVYTMFFVALLVRRKLRGVARAGVGAGAALLGVAVLLSGSLLFGRMAHDRHVRRGIVLPDEVSVTEGPEARAHVAFVVHGGLKVRLVDRDTDWVRVRLPNGLEGWVHDRDVGRL